MRLCADGIVWSRLDTGGIFENLRLIFRLRVADSHNPFALSVITNSAESIDLAYEVQESISVLFN
jgi:hypothetical protein